jgi:hypothetical protein
MVDLRGRSEPCCEVDDDFEENGLRERDLGFGGVCCVGMSCGIQRMPGSKPRSLAFMMG